MFAKSACGANESEVVRGQLRLLVYHEEDARGDIAIIYCRRPRPFRGIGPLPLYFEPAVWPGVSLRLGTRPASNPACLGTRFAEMPRDQDVGQCDEEKLGG